MLPITTESGIGVFLILLGMLVGITAGVGIVALVASEILRIYFSSAGDRDSALMHQDETG